MPVGGEQDRRDRVRRDEVVAVDSREHPGCAHGRADHKQARGKDPLDPPGIETTKRDRLARLELAHEDPGDQVAGDHEEDVYPDETARWPARHVVCDHRQHGDRAETLDICPVAGAAIVSWSLRLGLLCQHSHRSGIMPSSEGTPQ
jgi:hypothetical protein